MLNRLREPSLILRIGLGVGLLGSAVASIFVGWEWLAWCVGGVTGVAAAYSTYVSLR